MTLTLLDLYNTAATQEWSMYDNDAASTDEMERSLVLALNKAATEILYSYDFSFRERTHIILTVYGINSYDIPTGIIKKDKSGNFCVKINQKNIKHIVTPEILPEKTGMPEGFYLKGNQIVLYPTPEEKSLVTIEYYTLAIGENSDGDEIYALQNDSDIISVPAHLEELLKNAIISRTMLNSIASEGDENFSAYKKQSETAYRLLIKYTKGVGQDKSVKI